MNSSSHSQNWLGFSLSNDPNLSHSHPSNLFQDHDHATNLSIFTGGPKLEDFLGGGSTGAAVAPPFQFSTLESPASYCHESPICDSDLKTITASFFRSNTDPIPEVKTQMHHAQIQLHHAPPTNAPPPKKATDTFGHRTSIYRGVTRHRWTGRYEAHLWDNTCRREGQSRKGRQVYLGGYDKEEKAARAYDLAALKYWGPATTTNFPVLEYEKELENMKNMTRQEFVASLRRKSSGFSRGASIYRGVTRHHQHGRWQARIGRVAGNKDLYLGTFSTQEEAAEAYDIAAIKFRGLNAVTNFDISRYDVKSIANSNLPIGGIACAKSKNTSDSINSDTKSIDGTCSQSTEERDRHSPATSTATFISHSNNSSNLNFPMPIKQDPSADQYWSILSYHNHNDNISPQLFQPSSTAGSVLFPANPTFPTIVGHLPAGNDGSLYGGVYVQSGENVSSSNSMQYATPIALSSGINMDIGQSVRGFQSHAKPSLFQTPIYGME